MRNAIRLPVLRARRQPSCPFSIEDGWEHTHTWKTGLLAS